MYSYAAGNFLASLFFILGLVLFRTPIGDLLVVVYGLSAYVLLPVFADAIYYGWLRKGQVPAGEEPLKHADFFPAATNDQGVDPLEVSAAPSADRAGEPVVRPPRWWSATPALAFVLLGALFLTVLVAQTGYDTRRRVAEGVTAAKPVVAEIREFHEREKRFPNDAEAKQFHRDLQGRYSTVKSVHYEPVDQRVVVTMGVQPYEDRQFAFKFEVRDGAIGRTTCGAIDIDPKYLPGSCRDQF
jgi:hypothetical protein